jgi:hypothetical protein
MSDGAFLLLKAGRIRPESWQQAEIRLANLLRILRIAPPGREKRSPKPLSGCEGRIYGDFRRIWLICHNCPICYLNHSFDTEIGAVSSEVPPRKDEVSIRFGFYTLEYIKLSECSLPRRRQVAFQAMEDLVL